MMFLMMSSGGMQRICCCLLALAGGVNAAQKFDVVVYGGTAGGAMAAIAAAREGLHAVLVEPGNHIGGMVSGGLSFTDIGKSWVIGGQAREFYRRAGRRYGKDLEWYVEPHVAEAIFHEMLAEARVPVLLGERLNEHGGVVREGRRVSAIRLESGRDLSAALFVDASYEGDLMAQTGVSYTYGRESVAKYGESLAGVRPQTPFHQFLVDIPARGPDGTLLREISPKPAGEPGSADEKVQAYNFRSCFSEDPANQVRFQKPKNYDAARYELLAKLIAARTEKEGAVPKLATLLSIDRIPNHKADVNNNGPFSTDYIGGSWRYPNASYRERAQIWQRHREYQQGLYYFLANDGRVPNAIRAEIRGWGFCKDEFTDNDYWPYQLYIREARRMVGEFVMTQKDLQTELTKPDAIGMGSYNSDSHNVQRIVDARGFVRNEGDMQVPVKPYQIPYRVMLPKRTEVENLFVPVVFSASHVAYSSLRMEPQYMIIGQAAGVAAKLAIEGKSCVQDVDSRKLRKRLVQLGAVIEIPAD